LSGISGLKWGNCLSCSYKGLSDSGGSDAVSLTDSSSDGFGVVMSDDWFFIFVNNFVWFWLDHLNSLDFIRSLFEILKMFNWNWWLFEVFNVLDGNWRLFIVLNVFDGDSWLRNVFNVRYWVGLGLNPIYVLNSSGSWLNVVDIFNRVGWRNNSLEVWNVVSGLLIVFDVVYWISWWNNCLEPFLRNWVWDNLFDVSDGDWFRLDPFDVLNWNVFYGDDLIWFLRNVLSPFNVVRLRLEILDMRNLV
jgi:hypothetical protein